MQTEQSKTVSIDPRMGLFLLIIANIVAFSQKNIWVEVGWIGFLTILLIACGCLYQAIKWGLGFCLLLVLQWYLLPVSPKIIATSFSIFVNYARRMFPCLMVGNLMIKTISLRKFIVGLRKLHIPQKLIIPISVTLRYFPAIREEVWHIRDAMRLRRIRGLEKAEAMIVPLMISATETAEELSAAAVTRGIENPAPKTSLVRLHLGGLDWCCLAVSIAFVAVVYLV